jgi:hypothetical protein
MSGFRWRRRPQLPDDAARAVGLEPGERVLAWSLLAGGGVAVATLEGLRAFTPFGKVVRRAWTEVDHVVWEAQSGTLAVWWVGSRQPLPLEPERPGALAEVVHERVQASLVLAQEVPLNAGLRVMIALRKAADGTLSTQVVPSPGVRLDDPQVAERVRVATAALREDAGL